MHLLEAPATVQKIDQFVVGGGGGGVIKFIIEITGSKLEWRFVKTVANFIVKMLTGFFCRIR